MEHPRNNWIDDEALAPKPVAKEPEVKETPVEVATEEIIIN